MKKKINVILLKDHSNKGKKGNAITVSRGYALNYLIPNNIGEIATKGKMKHTEMFQNIANQKKENKIIAAQLLKDKISHINKITIYKKQGENNAIFGTITEKDIITWLAKYKQIYINRKEIKLPTIKKIGIYKLEFVITNEVSISLNLYVIPSNI
uniref:Large ribosomal subunit protein bL9c n=1 Tax=Kuetzingia canaliculata TaxID=228262 RepID=A0A1Z1MPH9_KUECA|nr:ribosomal protein L9 [Kuetzingia canaliculata]ARW67958.1 ribosomal protein L9 [Kuetzingia canaliculata]